MALIMGSKAGLSSSTIYVLIKKIKNENAMKFEFHENLVKDDFFYFLNLGL